MKHIHSKSIAHGDLKAVCIQLILADLNSQDPPKANILVDASGEVARICDFSSSVINCSCDGGPKDREGTVLWDSPELWEEDDNLRTHQSDIWAFGCVMLEVS